MALNLNFHIKKSDFLKLRLDGICGMSHPIILLPIKSKNKSTAKKLAASLKIKKSKNKFILSNHHRIITNFQEHTELYWIMVTILWWWNEFRILISSLFTFTMTRLIPKIETKKLIVWSQWLRKKRNLRVSFTLLVIVLVKEAWTIFANCC